MTDSKLTDLTALTGANLATTDVLEVTDVSDTTMAASGTSKKITASELMTGMTRLGALASARMTGWYPTSAIAENIPRALANANTSAISSGRPYLTGGMVLPAGVTVSSITFVSGTQAAVTPTNQWFCLIDPTSLAVLAVTADDTTTAWAATTAKTLALSTPYTPTTDKAVYVGIMVKATTAPSSIGLSAPNATGLNLAPQLSAQSSSTGLTTPASLPNPIGSLTAGFGIPYAWVS